MGIDIARLESQLLQMSVEGAPGREFCESISELASQVVLRFRHAVVRCFGPPFHCYEGVSRHPFAVLIQISQGILCLCTSQLGCGPELLGGCGGILVDTIAQILCSSPIE